MKDNLINWKNGVEDGIPICLGYFAFGVTDEIFGFSVLKSGALNPFYNYGLMSAAIPGWTLGTLFGVLSGSILPERRISALSIAIYGIFLAYHGYSLFKASLLACVLVFVIELIFF